MPFTDRIASAVDDEISVIVAEATAQANGERDEALANEAAALGGEAAAAAQVVTLTARVGELTTEVALLRKLLDDATRPAEPTPGLWYQAPAVEFTEKRPYLIHNTPWFSGKSRTTWLSAYLAPTGESGKHAAYGGYVRDMPAVFTAAQEIEALKAYGVDGVFVDLASVSHWTQITALANAATGFLFVPMVDANGSLAADPAVVVDRVDQVLSRPTAWRLADGRYVVGIFKAEGKTAAWWNDVAAGLTALGKTVAWVAAFNDTDQIGNYRTFHSAGAWSPGADPGVLQGVPPYVASTRQRGQVPLLPLLCHNVRPAQGTYDESRGLGALRASWDRIVAVGDCVVQGVTQNDFAEGAPLMPSALHGNALLAYSQWRSYEWRTGTRPAILAPAVFLSHRPQLLGATITGPQTRRMTQKTRTGMTASVDEIEVLTLLPAPARVSVRFGDQSAAYDAPAGEFVRYFPARAGTVSASVAGVEAVSPVPIQTTGINDAPVWVTCWSGDLLTVFDPRPVS